MAASATHPNAPLAYHQHGLQSSHKGSTQRGQACDARCDGHINASTPPPPCTADDVIVQFVRSSGAGGQNVNKVSTKVDMRFNLRKAPWLEDDVREAVERMVRRVLLLLCACVYEALQERNRINKAGELVISSQRTRSQAYGWRTFILANNTWLNHSDNLEDALQKLQEILDNAWLSVQPVEEDPEKKKKLEKQCVVGMPWMA